MATIPRVTQRDTNVDLLEQHAAPAPQREIPLPLPIKPLDEAKPLEGRVKRAAEDELVARPSKTLARKFDAPQTADWWVEFLKSECDSFDKGKYPLGIKAIYIVAGLLCEKLPVLKESQESMVACKEFVAKLNTYLKKESIEIDDFKHYCATDIDLASVSESRQFVVHKRLFGLLERSVFNPDLLEDLVEEMIQFCLIHANLQELKMVPFTAPPSIGTATPFSGVAATEDTQLFAAILQMVLTFPKEWRRDIPRFSKIKIALSRCEEDWKTTQAVNRAKTRCLNYLMEQQFEKIKTINRQEDVSLTPKMMLGFLGLTDNITLHPLPDEEILDLKTWYEKEGHEIPGTVDQHGICLYADDLVDQEVTVCDSLDNGYKLHYLLYFENDDYNLIMRDGDHWFRFNPSGRKAQDHCEVVHIFNDLDDPTGVRVRASAQPAEGRIFCQPELTYLGTGTFEEMLKQSRHVSSETVTYGVEIALYTSELVAKRLLKPTPPTAV